MNPIVYSVVVALIATTIVFLVLIALWRILNMIKSLFGRKNKEEDNNNVIQKDSVTTAVAAPVVHTGAEVVDDDELIAVITAALNACMGTQSNLIVRKITRVGDSTPVWGQIGRHEQTLSRL